MKYTLLITFLFLSAAHTSHAMEITQKTSEPSHQTLQCILGIEHYNLQQITASLNAGADVNYTDNTGKSLFHLACATGNNEIILPFITHKDIDLMAQSPIRNTPLHLACKFGLTETIDSMLSKNPLLATIRNKSGQTPLIMTSYYEKEKCVNSLMCYNTNNINVQDYTGKTALHCACLNHQQYSIIKKLILHGASTTIRDNNQLTPLATLFFLINNNNQLNAFCSFLTENDDTAHELIHTTDTDGNTQFHLCTATQNILDARFHNYLLFLASRGLNINTKNKDGKTAVDLAKQKYTQLCNFYITNKLPDIYRIVDRQERIIHAFLDVTSPNTDGELLTHFLPSTPSAETLQCIQAIETRDGQKIIASLDAGADVNHIDNNGKSLFYLACAKGPHNVIEPFITHKDIDLMAQSPMHNTPLHIACKFGVTKTVNSMLSKNPDLTTICNEDGETPLIMASAHGWKECVDLLMQHCNESTINMQSHDGSTALHWACQRKEYPIIKKLILHGARATIRNNSQGTPLITLYSYVDDNQWDDFHSFLTENDDTAHELIHATDTDGNTQFHLCTATQKILAPFHNYFLFLASRGLKIDTRNNDGKRAVDLAEQEYTRLYNFYTTNKLPDIYKVVTNQERVMHAFLRLTSPHMDYTLLTHFLHNTCKELPEELHHIVAYLYYAINIETIIAKKYKAQASYYNDFIENKNRIRNQLLEKPEPKLLWSM